MESIEILTKRFIETYTEKKEKMFIDSEFGLIGGSSVRFKNNRWVIEFEERGTVDIVGTFSSKEMACFALAMDTCVWHLFEKKIDLDDKLKQFTENDIDKIKEVFSEVFDNDVRYSLFKPKKGAVVLEKREDRYCLVYHNDFNDDTYNKMSYYDGFEHALGVLYNYSWSLYSLDKLVPLWPLQIDKKSEDYLTVIKILLGINR